jgi:hypothetical protein
LEAVDDDDRPCEREIEVVPVVVGCKYRVFGLDAAVGCL